MELSLVVPVFNEADNIAALFDEARQALGGVVEHEVIFVDDGSTDGTGRVLAALAGQEPSVRVLSHDRNAGQSAAVHTGVTAARAPWIATLDGDGQNDPADLPGLWRLAAESGDPADLYIGHRRSRRDNTLRILSSRIANGVRAWLLDDGVPDTGCGIKLFRRDRFLALPYFDHMHRFLPALIRRDGARVESVPVNHRPRRAGRSKYGVGNRLWVGLVDLLGVMWLLRRRRPPIRVTTGPTTHGH